MHNHKIARVLHLVEDSCLHRAWPTLPICAFQHIFVRLVRRLERVLQAADELFKKLPRSLDSVMRHIEPQNNFVRTREIRCLSELRFLSQKMLP